MLIASAALFVILKFRNHVFTQFGKKQLKWLATGLIVGVHWLLFFESIKQSTVSVALVSFSSTALFTSILEPIFRKKRFEWYELLFSFLIITGMYIVLQFEFRYAYGILLGIVSALLASIFTVLNSQYIVNERSVVISWYELLGGAVFMLIISLLFNREELMEIPGLEDIIYLLLLGIVATAVAFVVSISVMRQLSAFTVSLTINLEPLYGIILALLIFGDEELMSGGFYAGFAIILSTILINAYMKKKSRKLGKESG